MTQTAGLKLGKDPTANPRAHGNLEHGAQPLASYISYFAPYDTLGTGITLPASCRYGLRAEEARLQRMPAHFPGA